jgi:hypothetical protein
MYPSSSMVLSVIIQRKQQPKLTSVLGNKLRSSAPILHYFWENDTVDHIFATIVELEGYWASAREYSKSVCCGQR